MVGVSLLSVVQIYALVFLRASGRSNLSCYLGIFTLYDERLTYSSALCVQAPGGKIFLDR